MNFRACLLALTTFLSPAWAEEAVPETPSEAVPESGPAEAPPALDAVPPVLSPLPSSRPVQGTKLLFLRLNLRIKQVEQEMLVMSQEDLLAHLAVASDLLQQLRSRPLTDDEQAKADRNEAYLQSLTERYVLLSRPASAAPSPAAEAAPH